MDIDIDIGDRDQLLNIIDHIPASMIKDGAYVRHNTGVYFTEIPFNPYIASSAIDYKSAEKQGYFKIDLLNVSIYKQVTSEEHLISLMRDPDWNLLKNRKFVEQIIHIGNYYDIINRLPEPIDSIYKLAMFLAAIRPSKKHLLGKVWDEIEKTIWEIDAGGEYAYKKSHAISYAQLVIIHMNLLKESTLIS